MDDEQRPARYDAEIIRKALDKAAEQVAIRKAQKDLLKGKNPEDANNG